MTLTRTAELTVTHSLRRGVYLLRADDGTAQLNAWPHNESVGVLTDLESALLRDLAAGTVAVPSPEGRSADDDARADFLGRLRRGGWLDTTYAWAGRPLLTVRAFGPPREAPARTAEVRLLGEVVMRRDETGDVVLELPDGWCDLAVHDGAVLSMLTGLERWGSGPDAAVSEPVRGTVLDVAASAGMVEPVDTDPGEDFARVSWRPHERWFHERSRLSARGYFGDSFGGTFWARERHEPLPARPAPRGEARVALPRADIAALRRSDPPLTSVLEDRSSVRDHDDEYPLTLADLGEFLHRTSRVRYVREADGVEYSNRPYPSGGSMYELEVHPVVRLVDGLDPAMYHYDSHTHELVRVSGLDALPVQRMLRVAAHSTVAWRQPQVLLVVSARVGRVMWKYEAMSYALVLKHVGVLYQTMYSVATAMGLAACAVGSGDAHAFSEATGIDSAVEPSVGEFLLGSRRRNVPVWEM